MDGKKVILGGGKIDRTPILVRNVKKGDQIISPYNRCVVSRCHATCNIGMRERTSVFFIIAIEKEVVNKLAGLCTLQNYEHLKSIAVPKLAKH